MTGEPGRAVDAAGLTIAPEPFGGPVAQALVAELKDDMDARYADEPLGPGDTPEAFARWAVREEQVRPPQGVFLLARLDGVPAGCGGVRPLRGAPPGVAELKRMYVAPWARGRGVSRALLARLEAEAVALGYHRLQLETGVRQWEALGLYTAAGFREIAPFGQYEEDDLQVCLAKDLA